jgi:peptide/nickel transport system substrate-binding protein
VNLRVSLAGRVSIASDGVRIDEGRFPGRQGRLVFVYLVIEHGRPVFREELAEALWGDRPPATWEKALVGIASKLRALFSECGLNGAEVLTSAFGCYRLELPEESWVDLEAAAHAADSAKTALAAGRPVTAKAEARQAASIARLPLLPGEDGAWVEGKRRELADVLVRALEYLTDACLDSGDASEAAKCADELIELEPFRESGYRRLMRAHVAAGNSAEALRVYERCRRLLADELGAYPSPETESIYRDLLKQSPTAALAATPSEAGVVSATVATPDAESLRAPASSALAALPASREVEPAETAAEPMARRSRLPSRRVTVAATLVGAAVVAALGALVMRSGGSPASVSIGANAVGVIDSESGEIVSKIAVGASPGEVAVGPDAVWVTNSNDNSVSRIDPQTNGVRQTIPVGGGPAGVAVGGGAVWVANGLAGTVSRIDPTTNRVVQTITVGNGPKGVAYGDGFVWVTNSTDGTVSQIVPDTGHVRRTLPAAIGASGVAVGFGRVWIVSPSSGSVVALDPGSGRVLRRIGVGVEPDAIAAGAGAVWVANRADSTISRIDPRTAAVKNTIQVGRGPDGVAAVAGRVWVANGAQGTMSGIDPASSAVVKTVRLGNPPRGVALSPHGVYIAVGSKGLEHRGGLLRVLPIFDVDSIDPALSPAPTGWSVLTLTNDGLVGFRRVGGVQGTQLVPDLAVALPTPTDGGKTYTFQVRSGIRYSNGKLVQPDDFTRALERVFQIGVFEGNDYYGGIVGADRCAKGKACDLSRGIVTDRTARTVTFHLKAPDADFLAKLALPPAFAVPAGTPAHDVGMRPIPATGPYRVAEYHEKKTLRLVRNRSFREWSTDAQPRGYPDSISWSWRFGLDSSARVRAVERGTADVALGGQPPLPKPLLDVFAARYPSQLHMSTTLGATYFFLNTRVPPFDDVRVRLAINSAFDRKAFARLLGRGFDPTCQILPPNFPGYRPTCPYGSGGGMDLETARRLVQRSGTAGARVTVWVPSPIAEQGRYMVSVLDSLGYRARLNAIEPHSYFGKVTDSRVRAQIGYYSWFAGYPSAADLIPPQFRCTAFARASPEQNTNLSEFCDAAIDAQMARAAAVQVQDPAAASVLWQRVEQSLLEQAPVVPAYHRSNVDFVSKRLGNYQDNPQWGLLLDQVWVK